MKFLKMYSLGEIIKSNSEVSFCVIEINAEIPVVGFDNILECEKGRHYVSISMAGDLNFQISHFEYLFKFDYSNPLQCSC